MLGFYARAWDFSVGNGRVILPHFTSFYQLYKITERGVGDLGRVLLEGVAVVLPGGCPREAYRTDGSSPKSTFPGRTGLNGLLLTFPLRVILSPTASLWIEQTFNVQLVNCLARQTIQDYPGTILFLGGLPHGMCSADMALVLFVIKDGYCCIFKSYIYIYLKQAGACGRRPG